MQRETNLCMTLGTLHHITITFHLQPQENYSNHYGQEFSHITTLLELHLQDIIS